MSPLNDRTKSTPAYWLSQEEFDEALKYLDADDADRFFSLRRNAVPGDEDIHIAVIGETLTLLAGHGIRFPGSRELSSQFLGVELLARDHAEQVRRDIDRFLTTVDDQTLSDPEYEFLSLHQGEPGRIRRAIRYLSRALTLPNNYEGVMILHR